MFDARRGRVLAKVVVVLPVARRANRPWREATAAVGTDVVEDLIHARRTEGALIAADPRLQRLRRQGLAAMLAAWPQLQHQCIRAAACSLALRRLSSRGASRSRRRFTRSAPAFSGLPESNGGCGAYSRTSWIDLATSSPASSAATVRPKSMPAVTPPPEMRLRSRTTRSATGMAPKSFSMSRHAQWQADL